MGEVTIANIDWEIIDDIDDALTNATLSGVAVFNQVTVSSDLEEARSRDFKASSLAIIVYRKTEQFWLPEEVAGEQKHGCVVSADILVAGKSNTVSGRLQEAMRLKNIAINAVEGSAPTNAEGFGDENVYHKNIEWGEPTLDVPEKQPWAVAIQPVEIAFVLADKTSH